ncbi:hypothetical protein QE152_g40178 [Popillia japonica]|uniref:Uncharacterized protein n=1 Tax=Popillia japonica TaxID=7064 RepID=A0AAW1HS41_POPJA
MMLQDCDYTVVHRPGKRMAHVDALSRAHNILILESNTLEQTLSYILILESNTLEQTLSYKQNMDSTIKQLARRLENEEDKLFELRDGLVYRKNKRTGELLFYVPESMEASILRSSHDDLGHV